MKETPITRRTILRGAGACIALPMMESLLPRSADAVEKVSQAQRMAAITVPFGMVVDQFHPTETGAGYELAPTLEPLGDLKSNFTVFSNLDHDVRGGHAANHTLLSGVKSTERAGYPDGNITVDQRAAEIVGHETRFPSLVFWNEGMSFTRTGVRVPAVKKPSDAFRLMFVDDSAERRKFEHAALDSSGSILDAVREDAKKFETVLGSEDKQKLEEYFTSIRETEKKLELAEAWVERPKPKVEDPALDKVADGTRDEKSGGNLVEVWLDLLFLALQTNSTRVVTMSAENGGWGLEGKKIDPLGFALENFDAIGSWRTTYESGHPIDPSGRMPDGEKFQDVTGLKQIMVRDLDLFSRNLTTKLLTYATGRTMEVSDRPEIDRIVAELKQHGGGLRDLVKLVVTSKPFLNK